MNIAIFGTTSLQAIAIVLFVMTVRKYLQEKSHGIMTDDKDFQNCKEVGLMGGAYILFFI
jgi:hypothetical protein